MINKRSENKKVVTELTQRYGIKRVIVLAYHPQANGMINRKYKLIVDVLSKMTSKGFTN